MQAFSAIWENRIISQCAFPGTILLFVEFNKRIRMMLNLAIVSVINDSINWNFISEVFKAL